MRVLLLVLIAAPLAAEEASWRGLFGREAEAAILKRWLVAPPSERLEMRHVLDQVDRTRRFVDAGPVLVKLGDRVFTLRELFEEILEPALDTPADVTEDGEEQMANTHRLALAGFEALREAQAPPGTVGTGALNLLLGYANRVLASETLTPAIRLRLFAEVVRSARTLDGRAEPDLRTRWLIRQHLLPRLLALSHRVRGNPVLTELVSQAASLLYLPSILDEGAQMQLAPLVKGTHTGDILLRAYQRGGLETNGVVALAQSIDGQARDDAAFAARVPPLILELLSDPRLPAGERLELTDLVLERFTGLAPLEGTVLDLLACAFGGARADLDAYKTRRADLEANELPVPKDPRRFRFLRVVLVRAERDLPLRVVEVVRADTEPHRPIYLEDRRGRRRFVGVLLPSKDGLNADFLGPPSGITTRHDNRLLRRKLDLERIAITPFGARNEEIELCVALPEDASEPVPQDRPSLGHVLTLIRSRLERTLDDEERADLIRFLVRVGTEPARNLAIEHATGASASEILTLVEHGSEKARSALLDRVERLGYRDRVRLLGAVTRDPRTKLLDRVRALCDSAPVPVAAVAAEQLLLQRGDASGALALLGRPELYARAGGTALALRLGPMAGGLRIEPRGKPGAETVTVAATGCFKKEDGAIWIRYQDWLTAALSADASGPTAVREARAGRTPPKPWSAWRRRALRIRTPRGYRNVDGEKFVDEFVGKIQAGELPEKLMIALPGFVLNPCDPGRGMDLPQMARLLDALGPHASKLPPLRQALWDNLVILACAQSGISQNPELLSFAQSRLARLSGHAPPAEAKRSAGIYWTAWVSAHATGGNR